MTSNLYIMSNGVRYQAPQLEIIDVQTENCFAQSSSTESFTEGEELDW